MPCGWQRPALVNERPNIRLRHFRTKFSRFYDDRMEYALLVVIVCLIVLALRWTWGTRGQELRKPLTAEERQRLIDPLRSTIEVMLEGGQRGQAVRLVRERAGLSLQNAVAEVEYVHRQASDQT